MISVQTRPHPPRILTNSAWLQGRVITGRQLEIEPTTDGAATFRRLRSRSAREIDAAVINIEAGLLYSVCLAKKLFPWVTFPVLSVDLILTRPRTLSERLRFAVRRWLLQEVDRFILFYRDTAELRNLYRIPAHRVVYAPFKVNTRDRVLATPTTDEGFFLACGRSNRDYATLCEAMRGLPYECRILAPWGATEEHGTVFEGEEIPPNVTLVSDDGTPDSWNGWIARARAVVLPIEPGSLSPSGIGTYLVAMALGKAVIITRSPATEQILTDEQAVLVPPRDPDALRAAILRVAEDDTFRASVAEEGKRYALGLGGEERLREDVLRELAELLPRTPDLSGAPTGRRPAVK